MSVTRKTRVLMPEQIRRINECRQSGMTESSKMQETYFNNSHTIEIAVKDITIRIRNDAEPALLTRTFQMLLEFLC